MATRPTRIPHDADAHIGQVDIPPNVLVQLTGLAAARGIARAGSQERGSRTSARLGWMPDNARFGVAFFVNNLFDKRYVTGVSDISASVFGTPYALITPPRMWGIEAMVKF